MVWNFVCNEAYFKLYPVPNWEPMKCFQLKGNVGEFRGTDDNPAELFSIPAAIFLTQNQRVT